MKPPKNTCSKCKDEYALGNETAVLHLFTQAPGYSYLAVTCPLPACEKDELIFFVPGGYKLSEMQEFGYDTVVRDYPDDWVTTIYHKVTDSEPVKVYDPEELTDSVRDRHEHLVTVFAYDLEIATPEDIIGAPKGKLPVRWD